MRSFALASLLALAGCALLEPRVESPVEGSYEIAQPPEFARDWQEIDSCSGGTHPSGITLYVVDAPAFNVDGVATVGLYQYAARRITLARKYVDGDSGRTPRHEMLHADLPIPSDPSVDSIVHPVAYFGRSSGRPPWTGIGGRCGSLVAR